MKHRDVDDPVAAARLTVDLADRFAGKELRHRESSERDDQLGSDGGDLPLEEMIAGANLFGLRVSIVRGSALHDVCNENILTLEPDRGKELVEKLTGWTDERAALLIFVVAGGFANEEDLGGWRPVAGNGLEAVAGQRASGTAGDLSGDLC